MAQHPSSSTVRPRRLASLQRRLLAAAAVSAGALSFLAAPALAAPPLNEVRALNFARDYAVKLNGGLTVYRPAQCMFTTSAASNPCRIKSDSRGFTFRFLGGPPGWVSENIPATKETELKVSYDGRSLVKLIYNGPPR
ncbi:MAG: hypothetical protein ACKN89_16685 [Cyanobium sp.]|jgi:hypothetical protein